MDKFYDFSDTNIITVSTVKPLREMVMAFSLTTGGRVVGIAVVGGEVVTIIVVITVREK